MGLTTDQNILTEQQINELEKSVEARIQDKKDDSTVTEIGQLQNQASWWSVHNAMTISASTLFFGITVMIIGAYLVRKGSDIEGVLRLLATIVILVGALFLVVAGYTQDQVAPVIGLLGTIAGYLLGKAKQEH